MFDAPVVRGASHHALPRSSARLLWLTVFVAATAAAQAPAAECVPACRSGFLCHEGQCVSRCNPPCPQGTSCLENGECSAPAWTPSAAPTVAPIGQRVNRGWATGAGVFGVVSASVIVGLTALTIAVNGNDLANYTGGVTLLFAAVTVPIVAVGAGSGRWDPSIRGGLGWRIVGWVAFGLAMVNGVVSLGIGLAGVTVPSVAIGTLGGLGALSALCHAIDGFITGGEGRALAAEGQVSVVRHQPLLTLARDSRGGVVPTVGWALVF